MNKKLTLMSLTLAATIAGLAGEAHAEADPRDYTALVALPDKTVLVLGYYRHASTSDSASVQQDIALFRTAYTLKWESQRYGTLVIAPLDFILPVVDATVHVPIPTAGGLNGTLHASGIGDLIVVPSIVYGYNEDENNATFVGASEYVFTPTGNYDENKALNIGGHRWQFKQELYAGQKFAKIFTFEVIGNFFAYTANNHFLNPASTTAGKQGSLKQTLSWNFEAHLMGDIAPYFGLAASYYLYANGRQFDGQFNNETLTPAQTVQSIRATAAIRLEKQSLLYLQFNQDIAASDGASIGRAVQARISHFF